MARRAATTATVSVEPGLYRQNMGSTRGRLLCTTHAGILMWDRLVAHFERGCGDELHVVKGRLLEKFLRDACEKYGC